MFSRGSPANNDAPMVYKMLKLLIKLTSSDRKEVVFPHLHCAWLSGLIIFILRSTGSLDPKTFTLFCPFFFLILIF